MSNEREAFEHCWQIRGVDDEGNLGPMPLRSTSGPESYRGSAVNGSWIWFQRGAEWQRSQSAPAGYVMVPVELLEMWKISYHLGRISQSQCIEQMMELLAAAPKAEPVQEPIGWRTEDHLTDKSATTYDKSVADRWRAKDWPVYALYAAPQPVSDDGIRTMADLLPMLDDALEDLELHGRHKDSGYNALKDWYRKMALATKAGTDKAESSGDIMQARDQLGHTTVTMTEAYIRERKGKRVTPTR